MIIFLDFEASSLGKHGFPIEVGWAADDGTEEGYLIRPAPGWEEWSAEAEGIHGLSLDRLRREGTPHDLVANRMLEALQGHALYASAPSWDGQWLSRLLRAAGLPRHALRLQDTEAAQRRAVLETLAQEGVPPEAQEALLRQVLEADRLAAEALPPVHRALADARRELQRWRGLRDQAAEAAATAPTRRGA